MLDKIIKTLFTGEPTKGEPAGPNPKFRTLMPKEQLDFNTWARTFSVSSAWIQYS